MYIDAQIETIEQRPGQSPPIALERAIGTSTRCGHYTFTTWTGVHGPNKEEPCRKLDSRLGTGKADHAFFEWLTKGIKHHCAELAHFVEKQHATVRHCPLMFLECRQPRDRIDATANKLALHNCTGFLAEFAMYSFEN
jgi:hypothetical protein